MKIPFNKPHITGKEVDYIYDAVASGHISGNGKYTKLCQNYFEERWGFKKTLLTTSCTDALEMCAILLDIKPGDEVIMPSYTFVSTALAFYREGANIVFADSRPDHPGIDEERIQELITSRTRVIVVVHYAGISCDMDKIMDLAGRYGLFVVEDAAQAVDSYYTDKDGKKKPLGSIGHLAAFSFHETKNITSGEGGLLAINDRKFTDRAEIVWEKGTNRSAYFRGEVDKYNWIDTGSSFLPSEIVAAFLWAQLENIDIIQNRRKEIWEIYHEKLYNWAERKQIGLPKIPDYASNNAHMFYLICKENNQRSALIERLKAEDILAVFHYISLHRSPFYKNTHGLRELPESDRYSDCLLRLPLYYEIDHDLQQEIISLLINS